MANANYRGQGRHSALLDLKPGVNPVVFTAGEIRLVRVAAILFCVDVWVACAKFLV